MTSMAPFFNVAPRFAMPELPGLPVSEEDRQRALLRNAYDSAAPRGPVPAMMNALSALRDMPEAAPTPRMVSGGDVIGLMPEQSEALMDRIQRQNEIDQKMYEQRSLQSREEAMTREGRVMSAREAQQRRAEEFAIEKAKLDREDERDRAKMSRPTYQPISSNPGYLMKIQTNPDTNEVSAEVVKAGGVAIPDRPRQGWIENTDGSKVWGELTPGTTQAAPAQSQEDIARIAASQNINQRQWEAYYRDFELNGKPLTAQQISDIATYKADPEGAQQPEFEAFLAQLTPQQKMQQDIEVRRLLNSAKLSPEEDLQAWEMYKATGEIPTFTPNNSRAREFTWRDIMAEKARRRQADQFVLKTEAQIDAEVAGDFGLSVSEMRGLMRQRSNGSVGPSSGSLPDYLRRPDTPQPPAQLQAGQGFDDEASIPEGAQVQDEQGRILVKKNGKLVPVPAFGQ